MVRGVHGGEGGGGTCMAGEMATAVDGTHPTRMRSCYPWWRNVSTFYKGVNEISTQTTDIKDFFTVLVIIE